MTVTSPSADPDVLTIPQAARLMNISASTLRAKLEWASFAATVLIPMPGQPRISRPRLMRLLHGDTAQV